MPENNNGVPNLVPQQPQPAPAPQPPQPVPVAPAPAPQPPQPAPAPQPPQPAPAASASVQPNTEVKPAPVQVPIQQLLEQQTVEQVQPEQPAQPTQPAQPVQQAPVAVNPQPVQQPLPTGPGMVYQQPAQTWQNIDQTRVSQIQKKNNMIVFAFLAVPIIVVIILFFASGMGGSKVEKSAISGKSARQIEAEVNTFTNEAKTALAIADNLYTEISFSTKDSNRYLKNSKDLKYKGMCVTLNGLVSNGYYNKDLKNGKIRGVILIEVPFDGGKTKKSIWMTNETYAITGYEMEMLSSLGYSEDNNKGLGKYYYNAPSKQGIVTDITKADNIINAANGKTSFMDGGNALKEDRTDYANPKNAYTDNAENILLSVMYSPSISNGGTGETYFEMICINAKIN